ncbi:MAG TPA: extracellular solute-binding protein [Chloroflexota bacterium]|nr:extracellular solute-binding protein [Chloroflexota bacterium]
MFTSLSRRSMLRGTAALTGLAGIGALAACGASTGAVTQGTPASAATTSAAASAATTALTTARPATSTTALAATTTTSSAAAPVASTAGAVAAKGVQLIYLSPDDQGGMRHQQEATIFADFSKAHPDITVELAAGSGNWTLVEQKLKTSIASGAPVNLYQNGWGSWGDVQSALMELSSLFARDKLDPKQIFALPAIDTFTDAAGKIWAVPVVGVSQDALAYNKDLFATAGLQPPPLEPTDATWTTDKFLQYAQKLTNADKLQFGFGGTLAGFDTGGVTRGTYFDQGPWDDETQKAQIGAAGALQGLQFFKDLRDRYKVQPDATQVKSIGAKGDVFTSGKIGMQVVYGYLLKQNFNWGLAAMPHTGGQNMSGRQYAQSIQGANTAVSAQTWTLFTWLMQAANAARFPLTGNYAVSPVNGASALAQQTYQEKVGVDPKAFVLMSQHSHVSAWGMLKYPGWPTVNTWLVKNFPSFDQGQQTAADYGRAASDFINANLVKGS